jgi:hypothetical protein
VSYCPFYCQERDLAGLEGTAISHKINNILIPKNLSWVQKTATAVADTAIEALSMGGTENESTRHPVFAASALGQDRPAGN